MSRVADEPNETTTARRFAQRARRLVTPRHALQLSLAIAWWNFLGTVKWGYVAGALNGWKRPWYGAALAAATFAAFLPRGGRGAVRLGRLPLAGVLAGAALLAFGFFSSFPPSSWWQLPFQDDWPPRFQVTIDGIDLLHRGALSGWQWAFLGGYHTSSNLSQSLTILAFLPVELLGPRLGFHMMHAVVVAAIPLLVYWDVRQEASREQAWLAAAFACVTATGTFGTIFPSGDTNSVAGMATVLLALVGSHAARLERRWGGPVLVLGLTLTLYTHAGFFFYAAIYLMIEALVCRDLRALARSVAALAIATLVGLPLFWESLAYPGYTNANNLVFDSRTALSWLQVVKKVYYNIEILAQPYRWFNDYYALSLVFLPVLVVAAFLARSRTAFYAWCGVVSIAMLWLNNPNFGYVFSREIHMLAIFAPPVLAWFILEHAGSRVLAVALVAIVALYVQASFGPIPHVSDVTDFDRALVQRVAGSDGNLVMLENNPHRSVTLVAGERSLPSRFGTHFEAYLPAPTGKRFYGEEWDGWVWSRFRMQILGGGAFRGQAIGDTRVADFVAELRKWGIRHVIAWSAPTTKYLESSGAFAARWSSAPWTDFELLDADTREVITRTGTGSVRTRDMLGADLVLNDVREGDTVIVRTNYYPAWRASAGSSNVELFEHGGQMAFSAPRTGSYTVRLEYPRRTWLLAACLSLLVVGMVALRGRQGAPPTQ